MIDEEIQTAPNLKEEECEDRNNTKSAIVAASGFCLSIFFIWWALIILVRFYVFENILYNVFICCMLVIGKLTKFFISSSETSLILKLHRNNFQCDVSEHLPRRFSRARKFSAFHHRITTHNFLDNVLRDGVIFQQRLFWYDRVWYNEICKSVKNWNSSKFGEKPSLHTLQSQPTMQVFTMDWATTLKWRQFIHSLNSTWNNRRFSWTLIWFFSSWSQWLVSFSVSVHAFIYFRISSCWNIFLDLHDLFLHSID